MVNLTENADEGKTAEVLRFENYIKGSGAGYFDVEEMESVIDFYLQRGNISKCNKAIDYGFTLHPESCTLAVKRAKVYLVTGKFQRAYTLLCSLGQIDDYEGLILKLDLLLRLDKKKEAHTLAHWIIDEYLEEDDDLDYVCLDIAFSFMELMDFESAVEFLQIGDKYCDCNVDLLLELAFCREQLMQDEKAVEVYKRIIKINAFLGEAWFNLGQVYFSQEKYADAMKSYDYALTINEEDAYSYLQKAHTYFQLENYSDALEIYLDYEHNALDRWIADLFAGECYEKLKNYDVAIDFYQKSIAAEPENCDAFTGVGICCMEKGMYGEAVNYLAKAVEIDDKIPELWVNLGDVFIELDDDGSAILCYLKSISLNKEQPEIFVSIGNILLDKSEYQLALDYYLSAYESDRTLDNIELLIAVAYYCLEQKSAASAFLRKASARSREAQELFFEICHDAEREEWMV